MYHHEKFWKDSTVAIVDTPIFFHKALIIIGKIQIQKPKEVLSELHRILVFHFQLNKMSVEWVDSQRAALWYRSVTHLVQSSGKVSLSHA